MMLTLNLFLYMCSTVATIFSTTVSESRKFSHYALTISASPRSYSCGVALSGVITASLPSNLSAWFWTALPVT